MESRIPPAALPFSVSSGMFSSGFAVFPNSSALTDFPCRRGDAQLASLLGTSFLLRLPLKARIACNPFPPRFGVSLLPLVLLFFNFVSDWRYFLTPPYWFSGFGPALCLSCCIESIPLLPIWIKVPEFVVPTYSHASRIRVRSGWHFSLFLFVSVPSLPQPSSTRLHLPFLPPFDPIASRS